MLALRPLTADDLAIVEPWFDNPDTQRWLGGRDWPEQTLRLAGTDRFAFLAMSDARPVGLLDIEWYAEKTASFALAVDPARRRAGVGAAMLEAMFALPALNAVTEVFAGVEDGNDASRKLMLRTGFVPDASADADGFTYYRRRITSL